MKLHSELAGTGVFDDAFGEAVVDIQSLDNQV